jgi:amidase
MKKMTVISAFTDDAMGQLDAVGIADRIASGDISVHEALEAAIARLEHVNPILNGLVTKTYDRALMSAGEPGTGPFAGVPALVKDNEDVAGVPTLHGSRALPQVPARRNSPFVDQFEAMGLVSLGKTSMPEFGLTATTEPLLGGPTRNPWHSGFSAGGSSGGSAALVAAGAVPIATANDGGGSTRIPASCCGLVGFKPSRGRLVHMPLSRSLPVNVVHEGVLTRSVRDTAAFIAGLEALHYNPDLPRVGQVKFPGKKRLRLAFYTDPFCGDRTDPEVAGAVRTVAARCAALGHEVEEILPPFSAEVMDDFVAYWGMMALSIRLMGKRMFGLGFDASAMEPHTRGLVRHVRKKLIRTPAIIARLKRFAARYENCLGQYDAFLTPVTGSRVPEIGHVGPEVDFDTLMPRMRQFVPFTFIQNLSGAPSMALPSGLSDSRGLPVGVQFSGHAGADRALLELAFEMESAHPWPLLFDRVRELTDNAA